MSVITIWNSIVKGNGEALRKELDARKDCTRLGRRTDNHGWNMLHHAAVSGSFECVQLIATRIDPDFEMRCHEGFTPLARACERSAPLKIITYLIQMAKSSINIGNNENVTPLHHAVAMNRLDLVEVLVTNGANVSALDYSEESPSDTAAFDTGHLRILIYLLFVAKSPHPNVIEFSARAMYEVGKKIAIFKILFNLKYPQHMQRQRYDVSDVLVPALLSSRSISLIPYFIETEMKWEKNEIVKSLYEGLNNNDYGILAMLVWCEVRHLSASDESEVIDFSREFQYCQTVLTLVKLASAAVVGKDEGEIKEAADLLDKLLSFLKFTKSTIIGPEVPLVFEKLIDELHFQCSKEKSVRDWDTNIRLRYQRVVDLLIPCYGGDIDQFVSERIQQVQKLWLLKLVLPFIGYCSYLFMYPEFKPHRHLPFKIVCRSIGTMQAQKALLLHSSCFTLKRLARDCVRMAVYNGMESTKAAGFNIEFINRLESLDLPKNLKSFLKYCDTETEFALLKECVPALQSSN